MLTGELTKMTVTAYSDPELSEDSKKGKYTVTVNPEKYTQSYKLEYVTPATVNGGEQAPYYQWTPPSDLEFEFLFDSTGVFEKPVASPNPGQLNPLEKEDKGIQKEIEEFLKIVYIYDGNIHKPNYLKVNWGRLSFACVLSEVSIEYKLFDSQGNPIRAVAKTKFKNFKDNKLKEALEDKKSPDLTHVRIVNEGDTLPLMTKRIYGDSKYYLEVARVNKLTSFRKLKAGQRLFFPPIQKQQ